MTDIGKEYGTALFMLATEESERESYAAALEGLKQAFSDDPEYLALLSSPSIPLGERVAIIDEAFGSTLPEHILSYLKLLCEKGRISHFTESVEEYTALLHASQEIATAKVTSAVALTEAEKKKLIGSLEAMKKCKVQAEYFVDSTLLGGLIVEVDGKVMDGSLRHRLHEVKEVMNT